MSKNNLVIGGMATIVVVAIIVLLVVRNTETPPEAPVAAAGEQAAAGETKPGKALVKQPSAKQPTGKSAAGSNNAGAAAGGIDLTAAPAPVPSHLAGHGSSFWGSDYRGSSYAGAGYRVTSYMKNGGNQGGFRETKVLTTTRIPSGSANGYYGPSRSGSGYAYGSAGPRGGYYSGSAVRKTEVYGTAGPRPSMYPNPAYGGGSAAYPSGRGYGSASSAAGYDTMRRGYYGSASSFAPRSGSMVRPLPNSSSQTDQKLDELEFRAEEVEQRVNSLIQKIRNKKS